MPIGSDERSISLNSELTSDRQAVDRLRERTEGRLTKSPFGENAIIELSINSSALGPMQNIEKCSGCSGFPRNRDSERSPQPANLVQITDKWLRLYFSYIFLVLSTDNLPNVPEQ